METLFTLFPLFPKIYNLLKIKPLQVNNKKIYCLLTEKF